MYLDKLHSEDTLCEINLRTIPCSLSRYIFSKVLIVQVISYYDGVHPTTPYVAFVSYHSWGYSALTDIDLAGDMKYHI